MTLTSIDNDDIRYNPAEQAFQALVTLPGPTGVWLVAASYSPRSPRRTILCGPD